MMAQELELLLQRRKIASSFKNSQFLTIERWIISCNSKAQLENCKNFVETTKENIRKLDSLTRLDDEVFAALFDMIENSPYYK